MGKHECWHNISNCEACQQYKNCHDAEPLMNHEIPEKYWTKVGTNLFKIQERIYLIVVDDYSKYFEISKLFNNTPPIGIKYMKAMFARYGIPKLVFSDNGPEFPSLECRKFSADWYFEHDTSSPEFARSDVMVERMRQTVKRTRLKCLKSGTTNTSHC